MRNKLERTIEKDYFSDKKNYRQYIPDVINLFMGLAAEHGTELGVGFDDLSKSGLIWVISKNKVHINRLPETEGSLTATTWPTKAGKIRCNRYYTACDDKGEFAVGKSEWAIVEVATGKPQKIEELYPKEIEMLEDTVCDSPFSRPNNDFSECEEFAKYTIASTDIDANKHMNNVAYVRAVLSCLPSDITDNCSITDIEAVYKVQCYAGETLSFKLRKNENTYEIGVIKADGSTATVITINAD